LYGFEEVWIVSVDVAIPPLAGVTDAGDRLQVEFSGWPEQVKLTAAVKLFMLVTVMVKLADCPAAIVMLVGEAPREKSAVTSGVAAGERVAIRLPDPPDGPVVISMLLESMPIPAGANTTSFSEALARTAPLGSLISSMKAPVAKLKALIVPSPQFPTNRSPAKKPKVAGATVTPHGALRCASPVTLRINVPSIANRSTNPEPGMFRVLCIVVSWRA